MKDQLKLFGISLVSHHPNPNALGQSSTPKILQPGSMNTNTERDRMPRMTYHGIPNLLGSGFSVSLIGSSCFSSEVMGAPESRKPRLQREQQHACRYALACQCVDDHES